MGGNITSEEIAAKLPKDAEITEPLCQTLFTAA